MKYLLPCECGQTTPVDTTQAGGAVTCACGRSLNIPTFRALKELPPAKDEGPPSRGSHAAPVDWSGGRGALFSLGLLAFVIASAYGAYHLYIWSNIDVAQIQAHDDDHADEFVDSLDAVSLLEFWEETKGKTLQETLPPDHISIRDVSDYYLRQGQIGVVVTAIGGALIAFSLLGSGSPGSKKQ